MLDGVLAELDGFILETQRRFNQERLEKIRREGGTEIVTLDEKERQAFRALSLPVRETYVELAGPRGRAILDSLLTAVRNAEASSGS